MKATQEGFRKDAHLTTLTGPHWRRMEKGSGTLEPRNGALRLCLSNATSDRYSNTQIDDYQGLPRRGFAWHPPLRLTVHARFSHLPSTTEGTPQAGHTLKGTAGFGFWNDPFLMTEPRVPTLPRAAWFFYASPPSDMKLDLQVPGHGWKAATIDALRPAALWLAPLALPAMLLMNARPLYCALWPSIQRRLSVAEALLNVDTRQWHAYELEWGTERTTFTVVAQGQARRQVLEAPAPCGPLGFVMWMDNQYLVATPWGRLGWGKLDVPGEQWLEVDHLAIEPMTDPGSAQ
jgi:hypothetical protein